MPILRFVWAKHYVDIQGENLSARVGDSFPHVKKADGLFDYGCPQIFCGRGRIETSDNWHSIRYL